MAVGATCSCTTPLEAYIKQLKRGKSTSSTSASAGGTKPSAGGVADLLKALSAQVDASATKLSPGPLGSQLDVAG